MAGKLEIRLPLRIRPLRQAGQLVDLLLQDLLVQTAIPWLLVPIFLILLALLEWLRYFSNANPRPWVFTGLAVLGSGLAVFMIRRAMRKAKNTRPGRDGERVVTDTLEALVANGWQVFSDVQGTDFTIGHVAIGPGGVFTIETTASSKPEGKRARVTVDRAGISIAGCPASREALDQASAKSVWLANLLKRNTSKSFRVRPVVLFPGWHIEQKCPRKAKDPWVLEPKAFLRWLERERAVLTDEQIALASVHLSLHIRRDRSAEDNH